MSIRQRDARRPRSIWLAMVEQRRRPVRGTAGVKVSSGASSRNHKRVRQKALRFEASERNGRCRKAEEARDGGVIAIFIATRFVLLFGSISQ